jgi:hypothetical protein
MTSRDEAVRIVKEIGLPLIEARPPAAVADAGRAEGGGPGRT